MSEYDIIRAWKDEDYLESLSEEQRSQLPENPAGIVEMSDEEMEVVAGGDVIIVSANTFDCVDSGFLPINCVSNVGGNSC